MNVTITPDSEANYILSSIASSKLHLSRDVALAGESIPYREAKRFYSILGLQSRHFADIILSILKDDAISVAMTKSTMLDRVCATIDPEPVRVERPNKSDHIISKDSRSESNKEPQ